MKKRILSICLAAGLLATSLWGCSPAGETETPDGKTPGGKTEETRQPEDVPKGRYVESTIDISLEEGESVADIVWSGNNEMEMYTVKNHKAARYVWNGESWQRQEESGLEELTFPYGVFHMIYGQDGSRYAVFPGEPDYRYHMVKLVPGEAPQELLENVFSVQNERGYYDVNVDFAAVSEDGRILLSHSRMTDVYTPDGELVFSMPQDYSSMEWKDSGFLAGHQYLTIGSQGYLEYDISRASGTASAEYAYQSNDYSSVYSPMASDGEGGFYIANAQGIHHMIQGGSIWETVADGSLNSLSLPSVSVRRLFVGQENDFYVWLSQPEKQEIKHYTYDKDMPSAPSETLTIFGLDLDSTATIQQAASMFQLKHPDVRVELIGGQEDAGSTTVSDTIRALNTELLGGNGADILILDGLPVESYIEKGVLEDMSGVLSPMISSGQLISQAVTPYTEEGGGIYQIPVRMILLATYGDQEAIDSLTSMEAMRNYQSDPSHLPLRAKTRYDNLMRQMISMFYDEIVDSSTGKLRPGKIKELLETVKVLGDACGAKPSFDESEDGGRGYVYNMVRSPEGLLGSEYDKVDSGRSAIAIDKIQGMYDTMLPLAVMKKHGYHMETVNDSYLPNGTIGINQASAKRELAEEFVLFALGEEVQSSDLMDGLPVNTRAVSTWIERKDQEIISVAASGDDGFQIAGSWPNEEERQMIFDLASRTTRPVRTDRVLADLLINETKGFFEGSISLEQAAQNAQNKADLYFSE